jgi:uncharacterized membrane-anchored protein
MNKTIRFWLILGLQALLILAVPAQAFYTQVNGRSLVLQTAPVDPYSLFQGYSVTLYYDISNPQNLEKLPGWNDLPQDADRPFYLTFQAPTNPTTQPPTAWKPIAVSQKHPKLEANQIALQGRDRYGRITYGLETYFMPEDQRDAINQSIRDAQGESDKPAFVVEVKVGAGGNAIPIALWLKDKRYQF